MLTVLNEIDGQILLFLNSFHTQFLDNYMKIFTGRFIWIPFYLSLFGCLLRSFGLRRSLVYLVAVGLAVAMADQLCASVLRPVFSRLRPSNPENPLSAFVILVDGYRGGRYGFPSCHASNSFAQAVAMAVICRHRKMTFILIGWAVANCYTRIYMGVHYPGDIMAGALIGSVIGLACAKLGMLLASHIKGRLFPMVAIFSFASIPGTHALGVSEVSVRPWHIPLTALTLTFFVIGVVAL